MRENDRTECEVLQERQAFCDDWKRVAMRGYTRKAIRNDKHAVE